MKNKKLETVDVRQWYKAAQKLCDGQDPYVMQYYGLFLKETANNPESLRQIVDILEPPYVSVLKGTWLHINWH